ncbi:universal stress protein [Sphingomonadaceae bacterium G21617-S1]|uniref:universal stress protein n=1 Tax=Rhizorhabdus sp. TaxID=1968843 RepID=UPI001219687C|nr:universal stress protein [Rhizorhabdus sp.]MBD3759167.1 universal stress protein [Rhizorhabdus sp.]MCZ4342065.1 universal stress protein [Sphingomonadaceae bacterium G21617-S1]TAK12761.1 MAG: universal stress protein [Rhizorhabdus sp.]
MRTYLVVIDDNEAARVALRFAARRATRTGGAVEILALVPQQEFVQWGAVQATMEEEARLRAEAMVTQAASALIEETGVMPSITVRQGDPVTVVRELLAEQPHVAALVLGAAASGNPGKLVSHFAGIDAGLLPCPLMIIPGSLSDEVLDRLS